MGGVRDGGRRKSGERGRARCKMHGTRVNPRPAIAQSGALHARVPRAIRGCPDRSTVPPSDDPAPLRPARPASAERGVVVLLGLAHFLLLGGYYAIRAVRDAVGTNVYANSDTPIELAGRAFTIGIGDLWLAVFVVNVLLAPLYAAYARARNRRSLLVGVLAFFAANAAAFGVLFETTDGDARLWIDRAFYVWTSVFVLFALSSFWSFASDVCSLDRAKRTFGIVAACGTLGQIAGSTATRELARSSADLSWIVGGFVLLVLGAAATLWVLDRRTRERVGERRAGAVEAENENDRIGGSIVSGFTAVLRSPYLFAIAAYILLMTLASTAFYYLQQDVAHTAFDTRDDRIAFFAGVDAWTGWVTLGLQAGVIGFVMRRVGMGVALVALPVATVAGLAVAWSVLSGVDFTDADAVGAVARANLGLIVGILVAQRMVRYAFAKPSREALFTLVSREERFKSKNFLDTVVYRGGDVVWAQAFEGLIGRGFAFASVLAFALVPVAIWGAVAAGLGASAKRRDEDAKAPDRPAA